LIYGPEGWIENFTTVSTDRYVTKLGDKMEDIRDLLEGLRRAPKILTQFVKSIPKGKLDLRRGEGCWTIAEHFSHLAQVQPLLLGRFERFINEEHPEFIPYIPGKGEEEPDTPPRMSMATALDQFAEYRDKQLALLKKIDDITWKRIATHPEYESYSLYILTRHVLMHDYWHMYRMEELWLTKDAYLTRVE
jgi:DinB superfamily